MGTESFKDASFTGADFTGASFTGVDFTGATLRDCDLSKLKVVDSILVDVNVSGDLGTFIVNEVDVTAFVEGELDRRHPERVQLRAMRTAADYRAMWDAVERDWADTLARAALLPESALHERVDDEWSFVETLRHLLFATDAWAGRAVLDAPSPFHRLGLPQPAYPPAEAAALGIDLAASPSLAEISVVRAERMNLIRRLVDGLSDDDLERVTTRTPAPGYPERQLTVARCLRVVMNEECAHRRYAIRDLTVLEGRSTLDS